MTVFRSFYVLMFLLLARTFSLLSLRKYSCVFLSLWSDLLIQLFISPPPLSTMLNLYNYLTLSQLILQRESILKIFLHYYLYSVTLPSPSSSGRLAVTDAFLFLLFSLSLISLNLCFSFSSIKHRTDRN